MKKISLSVRLSLIQIIAPLAVFLLFLPSVFASSLPLNELYANPVSGAAPLSVVFSGFVASTGYSVDFGDGSSSGDINCPHGGCMNTNGGEVVNVSHVYASSGTYTAKLRKHFSFNAGNCAGADCNVVATATVTVTSSARPLGTFRVTPETGQAPLSVTFTASGLSFSSIDFGDGFTQDAPVFSPCPSGVVDCNVWQPTHTYRSPGQYLARLMNGPEPVKSLYVTVNSAPVSGQYLNATPASGTAPLTVAFKALGVGRNAIDFGDGQTGSLQVTAAMIYLPEYVGTHTYTAPGTYVAKVRHVPEPNEANCAGHDCWLRGMATVVVSAPTTVSPTSSSCPMITRTLSRGMRGVDVSALQRYFVLLGMLGSSSVTGYFGPMTEGALQEWQQSRNIVSSGTPASTGWGVVGPRSRAALANCGL